MGEPQPTRADLELHAFQAHIPYLMSALLEPDMKSREVQGGIDTLVGTPALITAYRVLDNLGGLASGEGPGQLLLRDRLLDLSGRPRGSRTPFFAASLDACSVVLRDYATFTPAIAITSDSGDVSDLVQRVRVARATRMDDGSQRIFVWPERPSDYEGLATHVMGFMATPDEHLFPLPEDHRAYQYYSKLLSAPR